MHVTYYFLVTLISLLNHSNGARILGIFPMPGRSHYILADKLMTTLAEAGHHITMITPFPTKNIPKNASWEEILIDGLAEEYERSLKMADLYADSGRNYIQKMVNYQELMMCWVNETLHNSNVRTLLTSDAQFDLVIMEQFFNDAHKYFAHYFQCPLVLLSSTGLKTVVADLVRNPLLPADLPHCFMTDYDRENYWHRATNALYYFFDEIFLHFYSVPYQERVLQQAFPGAPGINELNKRVSLVLLNSHESLLSPVPLIPNMIQIGGYHVDLPKALPKDLQQFLNDAKDGVVYFSMGSVLKAVNMSPQKRQIFINVFKKLKQKVIWKFEDESISGLPDNVLVKSWVPQQDVLAHPNLKLFITHGGLLSTTETVYHGVPVLAIPVFADQFGNAGNAVRRGYGLQLGYNDKTFNEKELYDKINQLLTNPKYRENVKELSGIYHDRILKPKENLVYWINYVLRHKGAEHLKLGGLGLPLYKYLMLDIVVPLLVIWHVLVFLTIGIIKRVGKLFSKSSDKKKIAKKVKQK